MATVFISGANRGIGLELCRQFAADGWRVIAACRNPDKADALRELAGDSKVSVHRLDVVDPEQVADLGVNLQGQPIDVLINNAGVYGERCPFGATQFDDWLQVLKTNTLAPVRVSETLLPNILRGKRKIIVMITSKMGSMADNSSGGAIVYRSSKAALNAATKSMALDLRAQGVICLLLHPGWVRTDMGGPQGLIDAQTSASEMKKVMLGASLQNSGCFYNYSGEEIPW